MIISDDVAYGFCVRLQILYSSSYLVYIVRCQPCYKGSRHSMNVWVQFSDMSSLQNCSLTELALTYITHRAHRIVVPWCSGYHYCTTSFNKSWTQVLRRFKSCLLRVGDSRWWGSLTMVLAGNKTKRLSSVRHTAETIHHHHIVNDGWSLCDL